MEIFPEQKCFKYCLKCSNTFCIFYICGLLIYLCSVAVSLLLQIYNASIN